MKPISLLLFLFTVQQGFSQSLKKIQVGSSGCTIYTYCEMKFDTSRSIDSSMIYTAECKNGDLTFGVIAVKLQNRPENLLMAEDLLIAFLDHLKSSFDIKNAAGYGKGHRLNNNEQTRGILDYWEDEEKNHWKVKAWTDGKYIGVMYAFSLKELPESKVNVFLDGFRFGQ